MAPAQSPVSGPDTLKSTKPPKAASQSVSKSQPTEIAKYHSVAPPSTKVTFLRERFLARWVYTTIYESALPSKLETAQPTTGMELCQDPVACPQTKVKLNGSKRRYGGLGAKYGTRTTLGHKVSTPAIWFLRSCELGV